MINTPINETLPSSVSTAVLITLPATHGCNDYFIQAQGAVAITISDTVGMTKTWTIKSGTIASVSQILGKGANMFYALSDGAADVIEILPMVE